MKFLNPLSFKFISIMVAALSCTVLEDRSSCLCQLELSTTNPDCGDVNYSIWNDGRLSFCEAVNSAPSCAPLTAAVERGVKDVCAVWVPRGAVVGEKSFFAPRGAQIDSVYAGVCMVDCRGDRAMAIVRLCKHFATFTVRFKDAGHLDYDVRVVADCSGVDIPSLLPVPGPYSAPVSVSGNEAVFRVPRQGGNTVTLILSKPGRDDALEVDLGPVLSSMGYDWGAENLRDVCLEADIGQGQFAPLVQPWQDEELGDVEF